MKRNKLCDAEKKVYRELDAEVKIALREERRRRSVKVKEAFSEGEEGV